LSATLAADRTFPATVAELGLGSMSAHPEQVAFDSGGSFFTKAAWLSLIIPFLAPVVWFCILAATSRMDLPAMVSFFILLSSLALGVEVYLEFGDMDGSASSGRQSWVSLRASF